MDILTSLHDLLASWASKNNLEIRFETVKNLSLNTTITFKDSDGAIAEMRCFALLSPFKNNITLNTSVASYDFVKKQFKTLQGKHSISSIHTSKWISSVENKFTNVSAPFTRIINTFNKYYHEVLEIMPNLLKLRQFHIDTLTGDDVMSKTMAEFGFTITEDKFVSKNCVIYKRAPNILYFTPDYYPTAEENDTLNLVRFFIKWYHEYKHYLKIAYNFA